MSKLWSINWKDILSGFLVAVIGAVLTSSLEILTALQTDTEYDLMNALKLAGIGAALAGVSYLVKKFATGENNNILTNK